ncbi:hypothetical protein P691DRAFT_855791, partial [Macrolepiota fuliginosa MF-IS2]
DNDILVAPAPLQLLPRRILSHSCQTVRTGEPVEFKALVRSRMTGNETKGGKLETRTAPLPLRIYVPPRKRLMWSWVQNSGVCISHEWRYNMLQELFCEFLPGPVTFRRRTSTRSSKPDIRERSRNGQGKKCGFSGIEGEERFYAIGWII